MGGFLHLMIVSLLSNICIFNCKAISSTIGITIEFPILL